jgi:hypothetical protein
VAQVFHNMAKVAQACSFWALTRSYQGMHNTFVSPVIIVHLSVIQGNGA